MKCLIHKPSRHSGMAVIAVLGFMLLLGILVASSGRHASDLGRRIDIVEKRQLNRAAVSVATTAKEGKP